MSGVTFNAVLNKITTTSDGGWRIWLDVASQDRESVMVLSTYMNKVIEAAFVPHPTSRREEFEHDQEESS